MCLTLCLLVLSRCPSFRVEQSPPPLEPNFYSFNSKLRWQFPPKGKTWGSVLTSPARWPSMLCALLWNCHLGFMCADVHGWTAILLKGQKSTLWGWDMGEEISISIGVSPGEIGPGLPGCWGQTLGLCLVLSLVGKVGRPLQVRELGEIVKMS